MRFNVISVIFVLYLFTHLILLEQINCRLVSDEVNDWLNLSSYPNSGLSTPEHQPTTGVDDTASSKSIPIINQENVQKVKTKRGRKRLTEEEKEERRVKDLERKRAKRAEAKQALLEKNPEAVERAKKQQKSNWQRYSTYLAKNPEKLARRREKMKEYQKKSYLKVREDPKKLAARRERSRISSKNHYYRQKQLFLQNFKKQDGAVSEEQVPQTGQHLGNIDDLGTHLDIKDGHENPNITPKSLSGNKRSRCKTQKYGASVTATSDSLTQEVKENASGKKPRKRTKIKVRSEKELECHRKNMRVYREKRRLDPRREEEFKQKVSKQKREKLIEIHKNPVELANHRERRKEVNQRYRQNRKAKNDAANILSSLKSSLS